MALQQGPSVQLVYIAEVTRNVTPSTPTMQILRTTSRNVNATKNILKTNEVRADRQIADLRHGLQKVEGSFIGEPSLQTYDAWIAAAMGSTWASVAGGTANYSFGSGAFVRDSGSYITEGFRAGDIVTTNGFTNSGNNGKWRVIGPVTATTLPIDNTTPTVPAVTESSGAGKTIALTGKRADIGTTLSTFSLERQFQTITQYQLFTGVTPNGMNIKCTAEQMNTIEFPLLGIKPVGMTGASVASGYSAATTSSPFSSFDGNLYEGGALIAIVTAVDLALANGRQLTGVIGSKYSPDIFEGEAMVTGTISAFVQDAVLFNKFLNETVSSLYLKLGDINGTDFHNIVCNRIKYTGNTMDPPPEGGVIQSMPFQSLVDATTLQSMTYQRSNTA